MVCLRQQRATSGGRGQCPAPGCRQHGGGGGVCVPADPPGPLVLGQRHSLQGLHWVTPGHGRSFRAAVVWAPQAPGTRQAAASAGSRTPGDRARLAEGPGLPPGRPRARGLHASCPARGVILYYQFLTYTPGGGRGRRGLAGAGTCQVLGTHVASGMCLRHGIHPSDLSGGGGGGDAAPTHEALRPPQAPHLPIARCRGSGAAGRPWGGAAGPGGPLTAARGRTGPWRTPGEGQTGDPRPPGTDCRAPLGCDGVPPPLSKAFREQKAGTC